MMSRSLLSDLVAKRLTLPDEVLGVKNLLNLLGVIGGGRFGFRLLVAFSMSSEKIRVSMSAITQSEKRMSSFCCLLSVQDHIVERKRLLIGSRGQWVEARMSLFRWIRAGCDRANRKLYLTKAIWLQIKVYRGLMRSSDESTACGQWKETREYASRSGELGVARTTQPRPRLGRGRTRRDFEDRAASATGAQPHRRRHPAKSWH